MGSKIVIPQNEVNEIIKLYVEDKVGTPTLSQKFGYGKLIINRTLKENGVTVDTPGRRFLGGKKVSDAKYYQNNKSKILKKCKDWSIENREKLKIYHKEWRNNNREKINEYKRNYEKTKKNTDPNYKLSCNIRTAIYTSLKEGNIHKQSKTFDMLPYDLPELINHLEMQFNNGMTWSNYGEWHVDHIVPISSFDFNNYEEFETCWSLSNLQPLWGSENISKNNSIIAHQYKIRKQKQLEEENTLPFDFKNINLRDSTLKEISRGECEKIINEYEWLGYLPKYTKYHFGLYFNVKGKEYLGGVVAFQSEYGDNIGVWDKYGFTHKIIQLSRGVCLWWTPKNTASYMITKTLKWLKSNTKYEIVSATVDSKAGEIGTIYQSLGWYYVGCMGGNKLKNGKERIRYGYKIGDKIYNQRHIRSMIGTAKKEKVLEHFPNVEIVNLGRKKRYFKFIKNHDLHLENIKSQLKPYEKR